jgi:hypothetical protein
MKESACDHGEFNDGCIECLKEKINRLERGIAWYSAESEAFNIMRQLVDLFDDSDIVDVARRLVEENERSSRGDGLLGRIALQRKLLHYEKKYNDEEIKILYDVLIGKSWENADYFNLFQSSWNVLADLLGIKEVTDNGHGKVMYFEDVVNNGNHDVPKKYMEIIVNSNGLESIDRVALMDGEHVINHYIDKYKGDGMLNLKVVKTESSIQALIKTEARETRDLLEKFSVASSWCVVLEAEERNGSVNDNHALNHYVFLFW